MRKTVALERTETGVPVAWEEGGGYSDTGRARVWALPDGRPPCPVYVRKRGYLPNDRHALVPVFPGTFCVEVARQREDFEVKVWRVKEVRQNDEFRLVAELELVTEFSRGEWSSPLPDELKDAVEAAKSKAFCYYCKKPHFTSLVERRRSRP